MKFFFIAVHNSLSNSNSKFQIDLMPYPQSLIDVSLNVATGLVPCLIEQEKRKALEEIFMDFIQQRITFDDGCAKLQALGHDNKSLVKLERILSLQPNIEDRTIGNDFNLANKLDHGRNRSMPWTSNEDELLLAGIYRYGVSEWQKVASFVGNGRTRSQCGQRWIRCLNPNMKRDKWTKEEDLQLFHLVQIHGVHSWAKIAKEIGNRTDVQCRYRFARNQAKLQINPLLFSLAKMNIPQIQQIQFDNDKVKC